MKNYVTSAVLKEAPCIGSMLFNDAIKFTVKLKTSKGDFIAVYKNTSISLRHELASLKAGDKIDIFFRFESFELIPCKGKEQVKCFYDVKIHDGDIKRFKQRLWHEETPTLVVVIIDNDTCKVLCYLPLEKPVN